MGERSLSYQKSTSAMSNDAEETTPALGSSHEDATGEQRSSRRRKSSFVEDVIRRVFSMGYESFDERIIDDDSNPRTQSCIQTTLVLMLVLVVGTLVGLGFLYRSSHQDVDIPKKGNSTTCPATDPIMELEPLYALSGLPKGAVATDHPFCSQLGLKILRKGGNAVDAGVAVGLCLGVANPASSGIGGGAFMLTYTDPTNKSNEDLPDFIDARSNNENEVQFESGKVCEIFDSREVAPGAATTDMFEDQPEHASVWGPLALSVPGELKGLELAHARHGKLPWKDVVDPAIQMAREGIPINPNLAHEIQFAASYFQKIPRSQHQDKVDGYLRHILTKDDNWNNPLLEGEILRNVRLAETLVAIRDEGSKALYTGELAEKMAKEIRDIGGILTKEDLARYQATLRSPVVGRGISGVALVGMPPPSSGGAAIIGAAKFLSGFSSPLAMFPDTISVHRRVEALKHVFAIRMSLSDPAYNSKVVEDAVSDLIETDYIAQLREMHRDNTSLPMSEYGGYKWSQLNDTDGEKEAKDAKEGDRRRRQLRGRRFGYLNDHGTSHYSIVDHEGNAVSMTTSVNTYFGSTFASPSTGVLFSSTMDDFGNPGVPDAFGLIPSEANFIEPYKKALSSMSPTMVFRESMDSPDIGRLMLVAGASGGPKIISAVTGVIINHLFLGMPLFESIVYPRVHDQLIYHGSATTTVENDLLEQGPRIRVSNRTRSALLERGHRLVDVDYEGTVQAVSVDLETNEMTAVSDVRKGGYPAGY